MPIFNAFRKALPYRVDTGLFWCESGSAFAVEYASYPIVEGGVVQGAVVTFVDISARRQAEYALRQAHVVLEQRVSERTHALSEALAQLRQLSALLCLRHLNRVHPENPNTFAALYRSVLTAAAMARDPKNRELIAKIIAPAQYLNQPETVLNQVLTGKFADGLGNIKSVPDRADFDPMPWQSMAIRMLTQMKRWGYVKDDVNYKQIAEKVFLIHRKNHEP